MLIREELEILYDEKLLKYESKLEVLFYVPVPYRAFEVNPKF